MKILNRSLLIIFLVIMSGCVPGQSTMRLASGEDEDAGLGGTGMLASEDSDSGMGGTGILGEITGFGSIFVNGVEVEYDSTTAYTIDGKTVNSLALEIGDIVEVLTLDRNQHTQAKVINLRHEIVGEVESIDPATFSFSVLGQTIIQPVTKRLLPEVGTYVAVSGFRIDVDTVVSTRVIEVVEQSPLLRRYTGLPFEGQTRHWLVQMHVNNETAVLQSNGKMRAITVSDKTGSAKVTGLGIQILQLHKPVKGDLRFEKVIESLEISRGKRTLESRQWSYGKKGQKSDHLPYIHTGSPVDSGGGGYPGTGSSGGTKHQGGRGR